MEFREFRARVVEDEKGRMSFVAAPFNREAVIGDLDRGGWREEIAPGAFSKALKESDPVLLCDHDMSKPLARVSAGTLRLRETSAALEGDADLVDTSYARDLEANIRAGNKGGMSIGFQTVKDDWLDDDGEPATRATGTRRVLREVKLPEISCVTNPAYKDTSVAARDESSALLEERAASIDTAGRKKLADKGHALPDGSYPIPDKAHLHAAAVLAASHHGDWKAAKALIRRRAKDLGVDVKNLPGFGGEDDDDNRCAVCGTEDCPVDLVAGFGDDDPRNVQRSQRDDPDGKEYECIDEALRQLKAGDVKGAMKTLAANQAQRAQEPGSSTPESEGDRALRNQRLAQALELEAAMGAFEVEA